MAKMYDEGGLTTDGMDVDPVSGNDIPLGSNAEDVRDDVDAKLSSGEYVVPADVVKYVGVAQLEKLVTKAKAGLEDMGENGRIGGAPVGEAEEVVMTLGGDLNALDGYATGGMVPGTDIDGIINRVKAAAMKDPSIINMLKAKGVFIQEPQPQGQAQQQAMSQGAVPQQAAPPALQGKDAPTAFAAGGMVDASNVSDYNPYAYTPGFSAQTGYTGQAPVVGGAPTPGPQGQTCSPGYVWDTAKGMCVPRATGGAAVVGVDTGFAPDAYAESGGDKDQDRFRDEMMDNAQANPNTWMEKYDYSNPETLVAETMSTMDFVDPDAPAKKVGFLESITKGLLSNLGGGLVGKAMAVSNVAEANANASILRSRGLVAEADKIVAQVAVYEKEKGITNWPSAMRSGEGMTKRAMESEYAQTFNQWGKQPTATAAAPKAPEAPAYSATKSANPKLARTTGLLPSKTVKRKDSSQSNSVTRDIVAAAQSRGNALKKSNAAVGAASAKHETSKKAEKSYEASAKAAGATRGAGGQYGMAKGGLVSPRPAKPDTPKANKNNKKGLGRK